MEDSNEYYNEFVHGFMLFQIALNKLLEENGIDELRE